MRLVLLLSLIILLFVPAYGQMPRAGSSTPQSLLRDLQNAAQSKNLLVLKPDTFAKYVLSPSRPYNIVAMFTITNERCPFCRQILTEYLHVGNAWHSAKHKHKKTFFVVVDGQIQGAYEMFQQMGIQNVPALAVVDVSRSGKPSPSLVKKRFEFSKIPWTAASLSNFVSQHVGYTVEVSAPVAPSLGLSSSTFVIFSLLASLLAIFACWKIFVVIRGIYRDPSSLKRPKLWFVVSLVPYGLSMAGVFFDFIHSPPLLYPLPNGDFMLFLWQHGRQFVIEGVIMLFLLLLGMSSIIGMNEMVPSVKSAVWKRVAAYGFMSLCFGTFIVITSYESSLYLSQQQDLQSENAWISVRVWPLFEVRGM